MGTLYKLGHQIYSNCFAHRFFYKWNRWVLQCGMRGLGIDDFERTGSAEKACVQRMIAKLENPIVLDVGANIGLWSQMALKVNPCAHIYAFEPNAAPFEKLKNIKNIHAYNVACGTVEEERTLFDRDDHQVSSHASLDSAVITDLHKQTARKSQVKVITLDQFIEKQQLAHVDLLKIDVEGFEYEVLEGAAESIRNGKVRAIVFEFNQMNIIRKRFMRDFLQLLPNYTFYRLLPNELLPFKRYDPLYHEQFGFQNILAISK